MSFTEQHCLLTDDLFKDTYAIDDYLSKCTQKLELATLRNDLKDYAFVLYSTMVDILKLETEDIINLAENLTNLSSRIADLTIPVAQLCEEFRTLHLAIKDTQQCFEKYFDKTKGIYSGLDCLDMKAGILSSSIYINNMIVSFLQGDITVLDRAVNEYSFQYLYLKEVDLKIINKDMINTGLRLIEFVHAIFLRAIKENSEEMIWRCLRMYVNLNKQKDAEVCVREKIVRPALNVVFTQRNLERNGENVKILYDMALKFLHTNLNLLLVILDRNPDLKGFNFLLNCFWCEVDEQLCINLPNITAPGNPDLFQKRFIHTWMFLEEIASAAKDLRLLKTNLTFQAHMKRFNLPVYFEIRFQQIAGKFETEMLMDPTNFTEKDMVKTENEVNCLFLKISSALWNGIQRCFHEDVFVILLSDQFIKLMLLMLSRYLKWFDTHIDEWNSLIPTSTLHTLEQFIIYALMDINVLKKFIGSSVTESEFDNTLFKILPHFIRPHFKELLNMNEIFLDKTYSSLQNQLITFQVQRCVIYLQQVTSIPRLYRRTNRSIPKEPSNYVLEAVNPIKMLFTRFSTIMGDKIEVVMDLIIANLSQQYLGLVQEVLHSVCKTEESLRRLKSRNVPSSDDSSTSAVGDLTSDETKIREQIKLDVGYFIMELRTFALNDGKKPLILLSKELGYKIADI